VVTLQQAANDVNYSLTTPTLLPNGSLLTQVRYDSAANFVFLGYTIEGAPSLGTNPAGWALFITEQSSSYNPLPSPITVSPAVVETTSFANGTTHTSTIAQASTVTSDWQSATLSGQSVVILQSDGATEVQWWNHDVWYQASGTIPLSELEAAATSMISASSGS
jgi:hypothetical protein